MGAVEHADELATDKGNRMTAIERLAKDLDARFPPGEAQPVPQTEPELNLVEVNYFDLRAALAIEPLVRKIREAKEKWDALDPYEQKMNWWANCVEFAEKICAE